MDETENNESNDRVENGGVEHPEAVVAPESTQNVNDVNDDAHVDDESATASSATASVTPLRRHPRRRAALATGGLVLVAAIGGSGFVIGHYVARPAAPRQNAFGGFPGFPNFRYQLPNGASGSFGTLPGATTPNPVPANAPSAAAAARVAAQVDPGIVDISTTSKYQSSSSAGTGMVLSANGLVLTNNHVINGATSIAVRLVSTGATYSATVLGYSVSQDVALLQLKNASGLATVSTADSNSVNANQPVIALGNAGGVGGTPSVARGAVVATHQSLSASDPGNLTGVEKLSDMIQVAAAIVPGDSGGPLVNTQGQVIGMDTAGSSNGTAFGFNDQTGATTQGYAIPINTALSIVRTIESGNSTASVHVGATPILGVEISATLSGYEGGATNVAGVQIAGLAAGTPAAASGLVAGDIITAVNGHAVTSPTQLSALVQTYAPGDELRVSYTTASGATSSVRVTLIAGPAL